MVRGREAERFYQRKYSGSGSQCVDVRASQSVWERCTVKGKVGCVRELPTSIVNVVDTFSSAISHSRNATTCAFQFIFFSVSFFC